jgi:hypothetical protein
VARINGNHSSDDVDFVCQILDVSTFILSLDLSLFTLMLIDSIGLSRGCRLLPWVPVLHGPTAHSRPSAPHRASDATTSRGRAVLLGVLCRTLKICCGTLCLMQHPLNSSYEIATRDWIYCPQWNWSSLSPLWSHCCQFYLCYQTNLVDNITTIFCSTY